MSQCNVQLEHPGASLEQEDPPVRGSPAGYAVAVALTALAALVRWSLPGVFEVTPFLVFYPAVVLAAAFGGLGPGLLAAASSALVVGLMFDPTFGWHHFAQLLVWERVGSIWRAASASV